MVSRFIGRDYITLREEILKFLKQRLPADWDDSNLADPVVIFAESLACMGDQLHYTIDELRRECDMATAQRASSIYSYAMREGYKMMLPRGSFGTLQIYANSPELSNRLSLKLPKFSELVAQPTNINLVVTDDVDSVLTDELKLTYPDSESVDEIANYATLANTISSRVTRVPVTIGTKRTYSFSYNDINSDSTVDLPEAIIDRDAVKLEMSVNDSSKELLYVVDLIGNGFSPDSYTLTPKFIGGNTRLCIEFSTNAKLSFNKSATFTFTYISIQDSKIKSDSQISIDLSSFISPVNPLDSVNLSGYTISLDGSIQGYTEFEDPNVTRENYKKYLQNYEALLTKDDYISYIQSSTSQRCKVFDHSDMYKSEVLPPNSSLIERTMYIITDLDYSGREALWNDLKERSSRSDCIVMMPFGKDPYTLVVKVDCFLLGTSASAISSKIKSALVSYYNDNSEHVPESSMIDYLVHKASDKVLSVSSAILRDSTYGSVDTTFNNVLSLNNEQVKALFSELSNSNTLALSTNNTLMPNSTTIASMLNNESNSYRKYTIAAYSKSPNEFPKIYRNNLAVSSYSDLVKYQIAYGAIDSTSYDIPDSEIFTSDGVISTAYIQHHYMVPTLNNVVVLINAVSA